MVRLKKSIKEVLIVEGKSDTRKLKSLFICDTIETNGLALDDHTMELIRLAAQNRGVIIFTDPDWAGKKIRDQILREIPQCKQAFVPREKAIAKGKLGVAEADSQAIYDALENAVHFETTRSSITWEQFLECDIIGHKDRRLKVYDYFHLGYGNVKTLFKRLNMVGVTAAQLKKALAS